MTLAASPQRSSDWRPLVSNLRRPHGFEALKVEGVLPEELVGTLYRNGPACFQAGSERYGHWFDGDGAVSAIRLDGRGGVRGSIRFVDTEARRTEQELGTLRFGGYGTTSKHPLWDFFLGSPRNSANTSVLPWQGRLLALWEGGLPTELDLETLETRGITNLQGVIPEAFSAHPHRVPTRRCWYNIGLTVGRTATIDLFELPDQGQPRRLTRLPIGASMLHDFAVTERRAVLLVSPLKLRLVDLMLGRAAYANALDWLEHQGTEVVLIDLDAPHTVRRFPVPAFYQWHFANAFEGEDGRVHVDFVRYDDFDTNDWLVGLYNGSIDRTASGRLVRGVIDPRAETLEIDTLWDGSAEFPICDGRFEGQRTRILWSNGHSSEHAASTTPLDRILRVDLDSGAVTHSQLGPGTFPAEPIFVPRGQNEGDGWLLTVAYAADQGRSFLTVLDATTLEESGRAWFDQPIPGTFHGRWLAGGAPA